jgi:hypothetical protein
MIILTHYMMTGVTEKTDKMTNNDLQKTTQKTTDLATRIQLILGVSSVLRKGEQFHFRCIKTNMCGYVLQVEVEQ